MYLQIFGRCLKVGDSDLVYDILGSDKYEFIDCVIEDDYEVFNSLQGLPVADTWEPVRVVRVRIDDDGEATQPSDFPCYPGGDLILRQRAVFALRDILEEGGEILPLKTDDNVPLFVLNVTRVLDAKDEDKSHIVRFPDSGQSMTVWAHAFHEPVIRDVPFFKLPYRGSPMFVGEPFRERVQEAGLVGLDFILAWSPETGAVYPKLW